MYEGLSVLTLILCGYLFYFLTIGISNTCTAADVKTAYKKLALKYHPDKAREPKCRADAELLFKLVAQANSILSDPALRRKHDHQCFAAMARETRERYAASRHGMGHRMGRSTSFNF